MMGYGRQAGMDRVDQYHFLKKLILLTEILIGKATRGPRSYHHWQWISCILIPELEQVMSSTNINVFIESISAFVV